MCIYIVLFGSNSPKISVLFYMNSEKKSVLFGSFPLKVLVLFDMNSDKRFVILFCIRSLQMSELFQMNSKIIALLVVKILLSLWKVWKTILKDYFLFFIFKEHLAFHLLNWQGVCPMWAISISFVYIVLLFWAFPQPHKLNLTFRLKSFLLLDFAFCLFVWLIKFKYVSHPSHDYDCFRGSYVILRG